MVSGGYSDGMPRFQLESPWSHVIRGFVDFGDQFVCNDRNGEQPKEAFIESITKVIDNLQTDE